MADLTNEIFTFGEDRGEGGGGWLTISSWGELCRSEKPYSVFWRSETDREEAAREAAAAERQALNKESDSDESDAEQEENQPDTIKEQDTTHDIKKKANADDNSTDDEASADELESGILSNAYALLNKPSPEQVPRYRRQRQPPANRQQSQFRIMLVCPPDKCNMLQLVPIPGTGQYFVDINNELEDTVSDFTVHAGASITTVRTLTEAYPIAKQFLWSAMGRIKSNLSMTPEGRSINIRHRVRLGRKTLHYSILDECDGPEDITTAYQLCSILNGNLNRGSAFIDSVSPSEYNRIAAELENDKVTESEVFQLHMTVRGQGYRVTCVDVAGGLEVKKVKNRSIKHTVVDIMLPGHYDLRYDIRTTVNINASDPVHGAIQQICSQIQFTKANLSFSVSADAVFPQQLPFKLTAIRFKRKKQFHTAGVSNQESYAVKVSMSKTHQFEVNFSNSSHRPFKPGVIQATGSDRFEVGAQLLSSKRLFDIVKSTSALSTGEVLSSCQGMLPNSLYAMRQLNRSDALQLQLAIDRHQPMPANVNPQSEDTLMNEEEGSDDADDEV